MNDETEQRSGASLYGELAEPISSSSVRGQTAITATKETLDRDVESLLLEILTVHGES